MGSSGVAPGATVTPYSWGQGCASHVGVSFHPYFCFPDVLWDMGMRRVSRAIQGDARHGRLLPRGRGTYWHPLIVGTKGWCPIHSILVTPLLV